MHKNNNRCTYVTIWIHTLKKVLLKYTAVVHTCLKLHNKIFAKNCPKCIVIRVGIFMKGKCRTLNTLKFLLHILPTFSLVSYVFLRIGIWHICSKAKHHFIGNITSENHRIFKISHSHVCIRRPVRTVMFLRKIQAVVQLKIR